MKLRSVDDEVQVNKLRLERKKFPCRRQRRWIRSVNGANRAEHRLALNGGRRWLRRSSERPVPRHFSLRELKMSKIEKMTRNKNIHKDWMTWMDVSNQ